MTRNANRAVIAGVGTSRFGRFVDIRIETLAWQAASEAMQTAGCDSGDIDAVYIGTVFGPSGLASRITRGLGISSAPTFRLEAACASGTLAFHEGVGAIRADRFETVLVIGVEHLSSVFSGAIVPEESDTDGRGGLVLPALYALQATRYLHDHRGDSSLLAHVAHKNKTHGLLNERAHLHSAPGVDEILSSKMIASPLTLLQCCPMTDGAAAAVVRRPSGAANEVSVAATSYQTGHAWGSSTPGYWGSACIRRAMDDITDQTRLTAHDIDLFEVHDAFTIGEVLTLEALGLCPAGDGLSLAADGVTWRTGTSPVNVSGGLLSRGHPLGATGVAQIAEAFWQLNNSAGDRQLQHPTNALVETMGGGASGLDGNAAVVAVLERID